MRFTEINTKSGKFTLNDLLQYSKVEGCKLILQIRTYHYTVGYITLPEDNNPEGVEIYVGLDRPHATFV